MRRSMRCGWRRGCAGIADLLMRMGAKIKLDDQCVLNALYAARYHQLPARWNAMLCMGEFRQFAAAGVGLMTRVAESWHDPALLHFCRNSKPWIRNSQETAFAPVWRAYALAAPIPPLAAKARQERFVGDAISRTDGLAVMGIGEYQIDIR